MTDSPGGGPDGGGAARRPPAGPQSSYPLANCQYEKFIMPALGQDDDVTALFRRHHLSPQIAFTTLENFAATALIEQGMG